MTLMEKPSNVNKIFESNKNIMSNQTRQVAFSGPMKTTVTPPFPVMKNIENCSSNELESSRRSSGNSITIKITNDSNVTMDDGSLENILNENYSILNEAERNNDIDILDDTSNSMEDLARNQSKKKSLKERKKLVRSSAQQKHHLMSQESEDQPETNKAPFQSQNTPFDALFEAANKGNFIQSAHVEAKMAIEASKNGVDEMNENLDKPKNRTSSFRQKYSFKKVSPSDNSEKNSINDSTKRLNRATNSPKINNLKLGAPQHLTRSQSCKRPGSFKRSSKQNKEQSVASSNSPTAALVVPANVSGRRGTHGSIILSEEIDKRCESLPFDNLNGEEADSEICRVRQFNITNKGIINRGDSFKRSFKRSNNSLSSKKDISPPITSHDGNTLALPDMYDGFIVNKNTSNHGLNESNSNVDSKSAQSTVNDDNSISLKNVNLNGKTHEDLNEAKSYLVYMIGASSVGKNALIKQFQTSEYCGTYDVGTNQLVDLQNEGVTIALDGVESILTFVSMDIDMLKLSTISLFEITKDNDAFIVVYSVTDKASFNIAIDLLKSIRLSENKDQPVILVGNKSDLVRKRSISREDAAIIALKFGCKFVETSVAINDKVDDLLAGILKQIRLHESNHKEQATKKISFAERNMNKNKKHSLENSNSKPFNNRNAHNFISLRSTSLSRRFFRTKLKENTTQAYSDNEKRKKFSKIGYSDQQSFFHKIFNNIFKRRADLSHLGSVENLYTPPSMN